MPKKVTVIIPSKNRFEYTRQALESIYSQNDKNLKLDVLVVDDLSKPTLKSILSKKFPKVKFIINNSLKHGPGPSRNVGVKNISKSDYLAFLDNDDQWKPNFLNKSISLLENNKAPCSLCLTEEYFDGKFTISYKIKIKLLNLARFLVLGFYYLINNRMLPKSGFYLGQVSHMVFKFNAVKDLLFDETLLAGEDMLYIALATKINESIIVPRKLVKFRYEPKSNTQTEIVRKNKWSAYRGVLKQLPKTHKKGILHFLFLKYIRIFES